MRHAHVCFVASVCISVAVCSTIRNTPGTDKVVARTTRVTSTKRDDQTTELPKDGVTVLPKEDVTALPKEDVTALPKEDVTALPKEDVTAISREDDVTVLPKDVTVLPKDVTVRWKKDLAVLRKEDVTVPPKGGVTVLPRDVTALPKEDVTVLPKDVTVSPIDGVTTVLPKEVDVPVLRGRSLEIETNELDHNAVDNIGAVLICPDPDFVGKTQEHTDMEPGGESALTAAHRPCRRDRDCLSVGEQCCPDRRGYHRCTLGVPPPQPEAPRSVFLGLLSRECPSSASSLIEPWPVINCSKDEDCWPRLCCRDAPGAPAFCRSPRPLWERMASPGLRSVLAYLQCTPPPPPVFDLFPKPCRSTFDCFPNLCCQERGRKVCRPPKRSLLALIASVGQSVGARFPILRL